MTSRRRIAAFAALLVGTGAAALIGAGAASAHVTVSSPAAAQGGYATLTFKVPTESATASTTSVKVQLPPDQPLASVSILPMPGWSYTVTKAKSATPTGSGDAVSTVEWRADSAQTAIKPGEFNQFVISAGPLPNASSMTFKAIQTYSDDSVVSWIDEAAPGSSAEPDHPAPTLRITSSAATATPSASIANGPPAAAVAASSDSGDGKANLGITLGSIGVLLGAISIAAVFLRGRRKPTV